MAQPIIVAHRGNTRAKDHPPFTAENTIAAFEAAILAQADMVEFDVRRTKDGVLVIHHDPELAGHPLNYLSFRTVQAYNAAIPTLESALIHCKRRIRLDLELKETGYESEVINLLKQYLTIEEFVITSFQPQVLHQIRYLQPSITIGILLDSSANQQISSRKIHLLKPNFVAPHHTLVNSSWLAAVNYQKLPYWVWTVNEQEEIQRFSANPQVQAIITDQCSNISKRIPK